MKILKTKFRGFRKLICCALVIAMSVSLVSPNIINAESTSIINELDNLSDSNVSTYNLSDGDTSFTLNLYVTENERIAEVTNNSTFDKAVITLNTTDGYASYTEYSYTEDEQNTTETYSEKLETQTIELSDVSENFEDISEVQAQATYSSSNKVTCGWETSNDNKYWYNISTSTPKYVTIGCVNQYERKYSTYQSLLDSYMSAIKSCNNNLAKGGAILGVTDASGAIAIITLVAAGTIITDGIFLAILGILGTGATTGISALCDAYNDYLSVKDYYNLLK